MIASSAGMTSKQKSRVLSRASVPNAVGRTSRSSLPGSSLGALNTKQLPKLKDGRPSPVSKKPLMVSKQQVLPKIQTMRERFDLMLKGYTDDLPPKTATEVRIFLSSTFSDMRVERNYLMTKAYPRIKDYCYEELDLDFHIVDMRWGVTDDATNEHITEKLCLLEIANCQRVSLGPNFVSILGDRYGYRPVPSVIPVSDFDLILQEAIIQDHLKLPLLTQWYVRDDNAVPPAYLLQPINSLIPNFGDHSEGKEAASVQAKQEWWDTLDILQLILRKAVDSLHRKGAISGAMRHEFFKSVTEFEVNDGLLTAVEPNQHTICLIRKFKGLDNNVAVNDNTASRFVEIINKHGQKVIDQEVKDMRSHLQDKTVPSVLNASQMGYFEIPWQQGGVNPLKYPEHSKYIESFCSGFTNAVLSLINNAKDQRKNQIPHSEYYSYFDDILHHLHFVDKKTALFKGQQDILNKVKSYLTTKKKNVPLVLFAQSGGGKTSVMAKIFKMIPQWLGHDSLRMIRFLGTSPESSTIHAVLRSVLGQIADATNQIMDPSGYKTMKGAVKFFPRFIRTSARKTKNLVILLDSLDQLQMSDGAYSLKWLPTDLPSNVHIIVSVIPDHGNILKNARSLIKEKDAFVEIIPLSEMTGREIINTTLEKNRRSLTQDQLDIILKHVTEVPSPLYLKLIMDKAITWKSYTDMSKVTLGTTVRSAISQLFKDLEVKFGSVLIKHALGYLTIGLDGLTEVELEDVLSCDNEVLDAVYQYHNPPVDGVVTLPPMLWARIKNDLSEYLVERLSNGKTTMYWYHRQFIEVAKEIYGSGGQEEKLHFNLASLFMSEKGVRKDIELTRRKIVVKSADRQVSAQPLVPKNKRKLMALPYHLRGAKHHNALLKSTTLCNLKFIKTKIEGVGLSSLLNDYKDIEDEEVQLVHCCLADIKTSWRSLALLPGEVLARVPEKDGMPYVAQLLEECRDHLKNESSTFMPLYPCLSEGTLLKSVVEKVFVIHNHSANHRCFIAGAKPEYRLIDIDRNIDLMLNYIDTALPPLISQDGKYIYFVQSTHRKIPPSRRGQKAKMEHSIVVLRANVDILIKGERIEMDQCLTVHIDPKDLPQDQDIRVNAVCMDNTEKFIALCFSDRFLVVKDITQPNHPGLMNTLHIKGERGLESSMQMSTVLFNKASDTVISVIGSAENGTLWTSVNVQSIHDKRQKTFHVPGLAWFEEIQLFHNDTILFLAVKDGETTRLGLVNLEDSNLSVDYLKLEMPVKDITTSGLENPKLFLVTEEALFVHDLTTREPVSTIKAPDGHILKSVAVQEDEQYIYLGSTNGFVFVYTSEDWLLLGQMKVDASLRFIFASKDDQNLLSISTLGWLKVWDQDELCKTVKTRSESPNASELLSLSTSASNLCFSKDGSSIITDHTDVIKCWGMEDYTCSSTISKAEHHCFAIDDMILDESGTLLYCLNRTTHFKLAIYDLVAGSAVEISQINQLKKVVDITMERENGGLLYVAEKDNTSLNILVFDPKCREIIQTIPVQSKNSFQDDDIEILVTHKMEYIMFKVKCSEKERGIILDAERKGNLKSSVGEYRFCALHLKNPAKELMICYRQLTKIPTLGETWALVDDNNILIARGRTTLQWEINSDQCVSKIVKGTNTPTYFRPIWVEGDDDWGTICHGGVHAFHRNISPSAITCQGSDDGWCFIYDDTGQSINRNPGKKSNHNGSPVTVVRVSTNSQWVASVSADTVLKCWSVAEKGKEVYSLKLNMRVVGLMFDPAGSTLAVLGQRTNGTTKIALFSVVGK